MDVDMCCEIFQQSMISSPNNISKGNLNNQVFSLHDNSKISKEELDKNYQNVEHSLDNSQPQKIMALYKNYFQNTIYQQITQKQDENSKILFNGNENNLFSLEGKIKLQQLIKSSQVQNIFPTSVQQVNDQSVKQEVQKNGAELYQTLQNNQTSDQDDDGEEEEFSIWNEDDLQKSGVNTDYFIDGQGNQLQFYQIYRLRSVLYQSQYISRIDTIQEVIQRANSSDTNKNITTKQQYKDKFVPINLSQKKNQDFYSIQYQKNMKQQNREVYSPLKKKQESTNQKIQPVNKKLIKNQQPENRQKIKIGQTQPNFIQQQKKIESNQYNNNKMIKKILKAQPLHKNVK
ncbi:hypothetical protein ABPG72_020265 [Tetrahymena utriculariae]